MDSKKLRTIRKDINALRLGAANIRHKKLASIAKSLGMKLSDRGKEPTYESYLLPNSRVITIPNHSGALKKFTVLNILDQFEEHIDQLEEIHGSIGGNGHGKENS